MRVPSAFGLALRIASRSLRRTPRRTVLLAAFVAVPLAFATFVSTMISTAVPSPDEFATRGLGAAAMRAELPGQDLPPAEALERGTAKIHELVPTAAEITPVISQDTRIVKADREVYGSTFGMDGISPVHAGRFTLEHGVLPQSDGEAALSSPLGRRLAVQLGDTVTIDGTEVTVSGFVVDRADITRAFAVTTATTAIAIAAEASAPAARTRQVTIAWHLTGVEPSAARQTLQDAGWRVLTRADFAEKGFDQVGQLPALTLGVTLLLLALATLLVGAAFAVAASSSRREIGLLAASGASPAQRRLVLTSNGLVLGVASTVLGVGAGLGVAALTYSLVGRTVEQLWTELRLDVVMLILFVVLGVGGPVIAAWLAGRQTATMDPWLALHERPSVGAAHAVRRTLGWTVAALCLAASLLALATVTADLLLTALAAMVTVAAAAALTRAVVPRLARWASVARPGPRVALRSHAAAPGRGAALVAAIGAVVTVSGLVMLGVGGLTERAAAAYRPTAPEGTTVIDTHDTLPVSTVSEISRRLGATDVAHVNLAMPPDASGTDTYLMSVDNPAARCQLSLIDDPDQCLKRSGFPGTAFWYLGIVEAEHLAVILGRPLTGAEAAAYLSGSAIVFSEQLVNAGAIRVWERDPRGGPTSRTRSHPAIVAEGMQVYGDLPFAFLSPDSARDAGYKNHPQVQYFMRGAAAPEESAEDRARAVLSADSGGYGRLYVERGDPASRRLGTVLMTSALLLLALAATVSVLAVGLAAGELAPEFTTLAAVGASARFRRVLSAAYAAVTATLGVLLGLFVLVVISPAQIRSMEIPISPLAWQMLLGTGIAAIIVSSAGGWLISPRPVTLVRRVD